MAYNYRQLSVSDKFYLILNMNGYFNSVNAPISEGIALYFVKLI